MGPEQGKLSPTSSSQFLSKGERTNRKTDKQTDTNNDIKTNYPLPWDLVFPLGAGLLNPNVIHFFAESLTTASGSWSANWWWQALDDAGRR